MMDVDTEFMNDNMNNANVISYCLIRPRGCVFIAVRQIMLHKRNILIYEINV